MPTARATDPETSHEAAESVSRETLSYVKRAILSFLYQRGMTDEEMLGNFEALSYQFERPYVSPSGLRSRRSELVASGLVVDSGERRRTLAGRKAIVWILKEKA